MRKPTFSTILYVDSAAVFENALSALQQCDGFDDVQLIVVDPHLSEDIRSLCNGLSNASYVPADSVEVTEAYNLGLDRAEGRYINFTLATSSYSANAYHGAKKAFERYSVKLVSMAPYMVDIEGTEWFYGGAFPPTEDNPLVSLKFQNARIQLQAQAYFYDASLFGSRRFDVSIHDDAMVKMLLTFQLEERQYVSLSDVKYRYTVAMEDKFSPNQLQLHLWWYSDALKNFLIPFLTETKEKYGRIPAFVQKACYYLVYAKYDCNLNDRTKGVLHGRESVEEFTQLVGQMMALLDLSVIMERKITPSYVANRALRTYFVYLRSQALEQELHVLDSGSEIRAVMTHKGGQPVEDLRNQSIRLSNSNRELFRVRIINYANGVLDIEGNLGLADFLKTGQFRAYALVSTDKGLQRVEAEYPPVYPLFKAFGYTLMRKIPTRFRIPVKNNETIQFFYEFDNCLHLLRLAFDSSYSRLTTGNKYSYWIFRDNWMLSWAKGNTLMIRKISKLFHLKRELLFAKTAYQKDPDKKRARQGLRLRFEYWRKKKAYSKRHIWVTFDKLYKAGDNGEYMYQYVRKNQPDVDMYYIIDETAPEYERMMQEDSAHVLRQGTLKCQITALLSEVILATQASVTMRYDPQNLLQRYNKDLLRGQIVCIQHGLTMQKIAQYQNRRFDNTRLYCLASHYELENLSHPMYGYEPDMLKMTGLARYDGLVNRDQRTILITPSWRRNVTLASVGSVRRPHNDSFKQTSYFKVYNSLINDERLIDCAKRTGYRIVYLLHPVMSAQIDDFDRNDYVDLVPATGDVSYEKILCESSLMVTDYSGVQFDFAYMRKPIVYYHPTELPPHYGDGGMNYETMGFGPICISHEQVVNELCAAMERQCTNTPEYTRRADEFFAFNDHNSCERIYNEVQNWLNAQK